MSASSTAGTVEFRINYDCFQMNANVKVEQNYKYEYKENGVRFQIRFVGTNTDPGQYEIVTGTNTPLTGQNIVYDQATTVPYSQNLFYEPIPFEMLKTYETKPQIIVTVDGKPAVCHSMTCDYQYTDPVGSISSFTFDASTRLLTVTGVGIPTSSGSGRRLQAATSIDSVWFANT